MSPYYNCGWLAMMHSGKPCRSLEGPGWTRCSSILLRLADRYVHLQADVKRAYKNLAKKWHPDKHPHNQEEAKQKFQAISQAFESLMSTDEEARIEAIAAANAAAKM